MKFCKSFFLIAFFIVLADVLAGYLGKVVVDKLNENNYVGDAALLNYNLNKVTSDVVIVGSSTALCHYKPTIISDSLSLYLDKQVTVFNAGASTQGLAYDYALVQSIIGRSKPQIIIIDLQPSSLYSDFSELQQLTLRAYYNINDHITEIFNSHVSLVERIKLQSNLYRLNTTLAKLFFSFNKPIGSDGFYAHSGKMQNIPEFISENTDSVFNAESLKQFRRICKICREKDIKLIFGISPYLCHSYTCDIEKAVKQLCKDEDALLFDYKDDAMFQNTNYFFDQRHLNVEGAELFSKVFISNYLNALRQSEKR